MRLLDEPMSYKDICNYTDMIDGCKSRICVSDNPLEIVRMVGFANDYLSMIAQSRIMKLMRNDAERKDDSNETD
jgi:hypothetical protein